MLTTLRPLSLGELLDRTFQLYRGHFLLFLGIAALAHLPAFVIQVGLLSVPKAPGAVFGLGTLLNLLMSLVAVAATQAATVTAVSAVYLGQSITIAESYARVLGMLVHVILVMIGMGIGIGIGLVLLVVPGVILGCMWALTIPVVVLENADLGDALSRSRDLTKGHRWRVVMIFVLFTVLYYLAFLVIETPLIGLVIAKGPESLRGIWSGIIVAGLGQIATILMTPLMTIAFSVMYYDERVRKEAFDIQFLMSAAPAQAQAETAGLS